MCQHVSNAAAKPRLRFAFLGRFRSFLKPREAACHTAETTRPQPLPAVTVPLELRAMSLHNRNREAAERYLRLHHILSRGVCSDD